VGNAKKEAAAKLADERNAMEKELHTLQCEKLRASTHRHSGKSIRVLQDIHDNYVLLQSFEKMTSPPADMIAICIQNIADLKTQLETSSSTSFQSLSTTPLHTLETPRASNCITPISLNMQSNVDI
jgi:hypothetical protein